MNTDSAIRAVVAFPTFEVADRQWIESIRAKHDPEATYLGNGSRDPLYSCARGFDMLYR